MPIYKSREAVSQRCFIFVVAKFTFKSLAKVSLIEKVLNYFSRNRRTREGLLNSFLFSGRVISKEISRVLTSAAPIPILE